MPIFPASPGLPPGTQVPVPGSPGLRPGTPVPVYPSPGVRPALPRPSPIQSQPLAGASGPSPGLRPSDWRPVSVRSGTVCGLDLHTSGFASPLTRARRVLAGPAARRAGAPDRVGRGHLPGRDGGGVRERDRPRRCCCRSLLRFAAEWWCPVVQTLTSARRRRAEWPLTLLSSRPTQVKLPRPPAARHL